MEIIMNYAEESLKKHYEWKGKIGTTVLCPASTREDLSLCYTPGVAQPCLEIQKDINKSFELTRRWNTVAVITDGSAVLGLGDIGPEAGMPVMEGKCALFREFAGIDAFPICLRTKDVDEAVRTIYLISGSFGGINLEDIAAPRCFEIEERLKKLCDIPVFHDDQHGTAVVVGAALINALRIVKKDMAEAKIIISGAGSAGIAIAKHLMRLGAENIILAGRKGLIDESSEGINDAQREMAKITNRLHKTGSLADGMVDADVFIGVSAPGIVSEDMVRSMAKDAVVFPMANPVPEIMPELAQKAGARVIGTGRSDFPNQINNLLAFPGIFRGALDSRAPQITDEMKLAASRALASLVPDSELSEDYIIPSALDKNVVGAVAKAVAEAK